MDADSLASPDSSPPLSPIDDDFGSYSGGAGSGGGYLFPSSSSNSLGSATYSGSSQSHQVHYPPARSLSGSNPARSSSRSFTLTGPFQPSSSSPSSPHAAQPPPAPFAQSPPMSPASFSGTGDPFADPGDGEVYPCPIAGCRHLYKSVPLLLHPPYSPSFPYVCLILLTLCQIQGRPEAPRPPEAPRLPSATYLSSSTNQRGQRIPLSPS